MLLYALSCILYGIMLLLISIITKINYKLFSYSPIYVTIFYSAIFYPINIVRYRYYYKFDRLRFISKKHFFMMSVPGILYMLEFASIYWALLYVDTSLYIVGRTFTAFINVIFSKCYLKKELKYHYYVGLLFLICSYVLFIKSYSDKSMNTKEIIAVCVIFLSCITTSVYNNMTEKFFDDITKNTEYNNVPSDDIELNNIVENDVPEDDKFNNKNAIMKEMQLTYQLIFSSYSFLIALPISLGLAIYDKDFTTYAPPNILYAITGIFFQTYFTLKIFILSSHIYSGNQILTGLDLFRRVVTNVIAYTWFGDHWNIKIILANLAMIVGCFCIAFGALKKN